MSDSSEKACAALFPTFEMFRAADRILLCCGEGLLRQSSHGQEVGPNTAETALRNVLEDNAGVDCGSLTLKPLDFRNPEDVWGRFTF